MNEVIKNDTSRLTPKDREAIATCLESLKPLSGPVAANRSDGFGPRNHL